MFPGPKHPLLALCGSLLLACFGCSRLRPIAAIPAPPISTTATTPAMDDPGDLDPRDDEPFAAAEFFRHQRVVGDGDLPVERYLDAIRQVRAMRRVVNRQGRFSLADAAVAGPSTFGSWTELGPGNIGGRTRAIVIHPQNPDIMYAGGATGGVWKTTDGGQSWIPQADFAPVLSLASLAISPADPNTLFAGTGEQSQGWRGAGIFRTSDGGDHWAQLPATATTDFYYVNKIAVSPNDPARIYAATASGLWTSSNNGDTWTKALQTGASGCFDLALQPAQARDVLLASCQNTSGSSFAIFRNLDSANSLSPWVNVLTDPQMAQTAIAFAPSQPSTVYAVSIALSSTTYAGALFAVYRSTSNGDGPSWTKQVSNTDTASLNTAILSTLPNYSLLSYCNSKSPAYTGQGAYNIHAAVDPLDANRLWVGGIELFRSDDGGLTWGFANTGNHPDQHFIVFPPDYDGAANQTIINGNDGGIYKTSAGRGKTGTCSSTSTSIIWTPLNNSYGTTQFYHGTPYPGGASFFGGTQDNGTVRGSDSGGVNQWAAIFGGDGGVSRIDPVDPTIVYVENFQLSLRKSTDGGFTYSTATSGITEAKTNFQFITYYTFDPTNSLRLYMGGTQLWRTENGAASWTAASAVNPKVTSAPDGVTTIAVSPYDPNLVLFGGVSGRIYRNSNALASNGSTVWPYTQPRTGYVNHIEFDPDNPLTVYATYTAFKTKSTDNHIYRSTDGGVSWTGIDGSGPNGIPDVPIDTILVDPDDPTHLFAGSDLGIFVSLDNGATWANVDNPYPNTITNHLAIDRTGGARYLYVFTYGRGVWRVPLESPASTCTYSVQSAVSAPATGGTVSADITTQPGCAWSVIPRQSATSGIAVQSPGVGAGSGKIYFTVQPSLTSLTRSANFSAQNQNITVTQSGASFSSIGDDPAGAQPVGAIPYENVASNSFLTSTASDPVHSCTGSADFKTGWYIFSPAESGAVQVSVTGQASNGGNSPIVLSVYPYDGKSIGSELGCAASPDTALNPTPATVTLSATAGQKYLFEVSSTGSTSAFNATVFLAVTTPLPASTAAVVPPTATLQVGTTQQFAAQIGNLGNTAVRWSISPQLGVISASGLYTAPALLDAATAVTITAQSLASPALSATATVTVQPPILTLAGGDAYNAASYQGGGVSPGEIITLFGAGMGPAQLVTAILDAQGKVATNLGGTQVLFDGIPSPMVYSYASQLSAVVPYEIAGRATTQMVVAHNNQTTPPVTIPVVSARPALFTFNTTFAAALDQDNLINGTYPAPRSSILTLFGTGEGQTDPPGVTGIVNSAVYPKPLAPVTVQIAGVDAEVVYYGAAPLEVAGVLQVNVKIPPSVSPGIQPLTMKVGSVAAPTLNINVLGPDGRTGSVAYNNIGSSSVSVKVYRPDATDTPITIGTVQAGNYNIYPSTNTVGNDWYIQVNNTTPRVISNVCTYVPTSSYGPYWACAGSSDAPFPR